MTRATVLCGDCDGYARDEDDRPCPSCGGVGEVPAEIQMAEEDDAR